MKKTALILFVCLFIFSCGNVTKNNKEEALRKFINLPELEKIECFNSLESKTQFYILNSYLVDKCFEAPINDVIRFKKDGYVLIDWMVPSPDGLGLVYASGREEPFVKYIPYQWKIQNQSLIITKTNQFYEYINIKGEDNFKFYDGDEIVFSKTYLSLFQKKLYLTLKNKEQQIGLSVGVCDKWPVMNLE
ncbi:hypothetical protein JXB41_05955 [Candidatus Woesearchaeota archaeon]|nr:hypothetical protein [Candidatus Woesearchaeota archaeon]MBN2817676.1 hypothetical protein [Bacteroidales bacterium]